MRSTGDAGLKEYLELIKQLENEAARLREEETAKAAEETAARLQKEYEAANAKTADAKAQTMGYDNYQELFEAFANARNNIALGRGTEGDKELMDKLQPVVDMYRKEVDAANKAAEQQRKANEQSAEEQRRADAQAAEERRKMEEEAERTRLKFATDPEQIKDIINGYMGYDASIGNIGARRDEIRAGLADGSIQASSDIMRELNAIETYLSKIDESAAEAAKTPEAIRAQKEAEQAEAKKQRDLKTDTEVQTLKNKGADWRKQNAGTSELRELNKEARDMAKLQNQGFNKSKAKRDADYEAKWQEAQDLKKLGIKGRNDIMDYKAGEQAAEKERETISRMDDIIAKMDKLVPMYE